MLETTALLISPVSSLIATVQGALDPVPRLRLDVRPDFGSACDRARAADVALVLAHLAAGGDEGGLTQLLWAVAATRRPCATLVLVDAYSPDQAQALLRAGAADYLGLPHDLGKLAHLADALTRRLRLPSPPAHLSFAPGPRFMPSANGRGDLPGHAVPPPTPNC